MKGWFGTGLVLHEGDLACGSRSIPSGYSIELYMTRLGDGSYRISVVAFLYCEQWNGSPNQFEEGPREVVHFVCTSDTA
jgi:hypothetical protein